MWESQGKPVHVLQRHKAAVLSLCISGMSLFSSSSDSEVLKWSLQSYEVAAIFQGHSETVGVLTETLPGLVSAALHALSILRLAPPHFAT